MTRRSRTQIHIEIGISGETAAYRYPSVGAALAANTGLIARLIEEGRRVRAQTAENKGSVPDLKKCAACGSQE